MSIEGIKEGDLVWAKDPQTGEGGYYTVTWTTNHVTDEVVQITVSGGTGDSFAANELSLSYDQDFVVEPAGIAGAKRLGSRSGSSSGASPAPANSYSETIEATAAHPIWVVSKGWVDAGALVVGDKLLAKDGSYLTVTKLGLVKKQVTVYNFEVAQLHTYFVGQQEQWLVHNERESHCVMPRANVSSPNARANFAGENNVNLAFDTRNQALSVARSHARIPKNAVPIRKWIVGADPRMTNNYNYFYVSDASHQGLYQEYRIGRERILLVEHTNTVDPNYEHPLDPTIPYKHFHIGLVPVHIDYKDSFYNTYDFRPLPGNDFSRYWLPSDIHEHFFYTYG